MTTPIVISVEGNIGSGKSTLLKYLTSDLQLSRPVVFLQEPVDEWQKIMSEEGETMLQKFYKNKARYAFSFQMMAYISRLALLKKSVEENPDAIIITERSLYTDRFVFAKMLYDTKNIELAEYSIYLKWFDTFASDFPISKIIYVKTDPPVCLHRIVTRSRSGENVIAIDYLNKCNKYHNKMIDKLSPFDESRKSLDNVLIIDGNDDFHEKKNSWLSQITHFLDKQ